MKKITAAILVLCMLLSVLCTGISSLTYEEYNTVLSPYATKGFTYGATAKMGLETTSDGTYKFFRLSANAGNYLNSDLMFSFKATEATFGENPYIKLYYRTNSPARELDVSMNTSEGEKWMNRHPSLNSDEKWNTLIFNYNDIIGSSTPFPASSDKNVTIILKPFGSQSFTLDKSAYFDIGYIAMFETEAAAEAFEYNKMTDTAYTYKVLTSEALYRKYTTSRGVQSISRMYVDDDSSCVRFAVEPGMANMAINITHDAFSLTEYPYIKVSYRSNSDYYICDTTINSENGENWGSRHPSMIADGKFNTFVVCINDMKNAGEQYFPTPGSMNVLLTLKPLGPSTVNLSETKYFDIMYVAFFKTKAEADAYEYKGDSAYPYDYSAYTGIPEYSYASDKLIVDTINAAKVRKDEILHTNNTVPYEDHLTFNGITSSYSDGMLTLNAPAGNYGGTDGVISFTQNDIPYTKFPTVKFSYITDSAESAQVRISSDNGISAKSVNLKKNEKSTLTLNLSEFANYTNILSGSSAKIEILPFGTGARTLSKDSYFTLEYIGLFENTAKANAFVYAGEFGANMTDSHIVYGANILNPESTAKGNVYFISADGNDSNSGTSPDKAWKSISKLQSVTGAGSTVYVRRGDSFRFTGTLRIQYGVTYTSYGYGDKPKFIASIDGTGSDKWSKTEWDNIWVFNDTIANNNQQGDVGNICINGGELWGIKVSKNNNDANRVDNGAVYNGRTHISALSGIAVDGGKGLVNDLEFHHDYESGKLYLYLEDGNPGEVFDSIEIADAGNAFGCWANNFVIDNFHVSGAGSHGIAGGSMHNIAVTNCSLEWIGGSIQTLGGGNTPIRFGNAVESFGSEAVNFTIANCYATQVYDCCWTVQYTGEATFDNVHMYNNVTTYSNTGLEVWQGSGICNELHMHDNYTLFSGYGWSHQRPEKDANFVYGSLSEDGKIYTNCSAENNVNAFSTRYALYTAVIGSTRYNFNNNTYILEENKTFSRTYVDSENGTGSTTMLSYNYPNIQKLISLGTEKGSKFYFLPSGTLNLGDDPSKVFTVENNPVTEIDAGVSVLNMVAAVDTYKLTPTVYPSSASDKSLYYLSTNPSVATVDQNGLITANYPGVTTVKVMSKDSGKMATVKVNVITPTPTPTIWSKDTAEADAEIADVIFIGDSFIGGTTPVSDEIATEYYINSTVISKADMTSAELLSELESVSNIPDTFIISTGYYDYVEGVILDEFISNINEICQRIRTLSPKSSIVFVTPYNVGTEKNALGLYEKAYVDALIAAADDNYVICADLYNLANVKFALIDNNGNATKVLNKYLSTDLSPTSAGVKYFAFDLIYILEAADDLNVQGRESVGIRYDASDLADSITYVLPSHIKGEGIVTDGTHKYLRSVAASSGTSGDSTEFQINFPADFKLADYPIIKIHYRSNIANASATVEANLGVLAGGSTTRLWGRSYSFDKSGEVNSITIDVNTHYTGGESIKNFASADANTPIKYLRFKPYTSTRPFVKGEYFDIEYICFYKNVTDAANDAALIKLPEPTYTPGDVNGDSKVNIVDGFMIDRHLAGWLGYESIDLESADIDLDGSVSPADSAVIYRAVAGWKSFSHILGK